VPSQYFRSAGPRNTALGLLGFARRYHRVHESSRTARPDEPGTEEAVVRIHQLDLIAHLKQLYEAEPPSQHELQEAYVATIRSLASAAAARDDFTGGHVERVRVYSQALGRELDLQPGALQGLDVGAVLHDVGKASVSAAILTKPGPLTADEWRQMKQHPTAGAALLRDIPFLLPAVDMVANHYERWDGSGYPQGLRGPAIPLGARIVAVADAFDALTSDRVYRTKRSLGEALDEIQRCAGSDFDPTVVSALLHALRYNRFPVEIRHSAEGHSPTLVVS